MVFGFFSERKNGSFGKKEKNPTHKAFVKRTTSTFRIPRTSHFKGNVKGIKFPHAPFWFLSNKFLNRGKVYFCTKRSVHI